MDEIKICLTLSHQKRTASISDFSMKNPNSIELVPNWEPNSRHPEHSDDAVRPSSTRVLGIAWVALIFGSNSDELAHWLAFRRRAGQQSSANSALVVSRALLKSGPVWNCGSDMATIRDRWSYFLRRSTSSFFLSVCSLPIGHLFALVVCE